MPETASRSYRPAWSWKSGEPNVIDRATVFGLAATCGLLLWVLAAGAGREAGAFWQTSSVALVLGGAVLTTFAACPVSNWRSVCRMLRHAFFVRTRPAEELVVLIVALAEIARRDGLLAMEKPVARLDNAFLRKAFQMAIDGADASVIAAVLRAEMESADLRHTYGVRMLESMGRSAPVFGMIGTLIGLVIMLGRMDDPTRIGPGMAVGLLTTLYGLVLANVFFLPLARKLTHRGSEELLNKQIVLDGVLAIQSGDNPRIVESKLRAYLPAGALGGEPIARSAATGGVVRSLGERKPGAAEPESARPAAAAQAPHGTEQVKKEPTTLEWINSLAAADLLSSELLTVDGKPAVREDGRDRPAARARRTAVEEAA
jgi:chemotaxis protein MotA